MSSTGLDGTGIHFLAGGIPVIAMGLQVLARGRCGCLLVLGVAEALLVSFLLVLREFNPEFLSMEFVEEKSPRFDPLCPSGLHPRCCN